MIDRSTIERILDAAQIVDVVQEFVPLKKTGSELSLDYVLFIMKRLLHLQYRHRKRFLNVLAAER